MPTCSDRITRSTLEKPDDRYCGVSQKPHVYPPHPAARPSPPHAHAWVRVRVRVRVRFGLIV